MNYRYINHTMYGIEYHFMWVTKYRYQILRGDVALRIRFQEPASSKQVTVVGFH